MKRTAIALALALGTASAWAQAPAAPDTAASAAAAPAASVAPHKCEPKPVYPGLKAMQEESEVTKFRETLRNYQLCIKGYIDERRAAIKANTDALNAAATEHNTVIEKFKADQDAAQKAQQAEQAKEQNKVGK